MWMIFLPYQVQEQKCIFEPKENILKDEGVEADKCLLHDFEAPAKTAGEHIVQRHSVKIQKGLNKCPEPHNV